MVPLYNSLPIPDTLSETDKQIQDILVKKMGDLSSGDFASFLDSNPHEYQLLYLELIKHYFAKTYQILHLENTSVLDSGSSRHIHRVVKITDPDNCQSLTGFDGSQSWTQGNGYLPLSFSDELSGKNAKIDISNVDQMMEVTNDILSMGQLIRGGYEFHFTQEGKRCYGLSPGGAHEIRVDLGSDDILRVKHSTRVGLDSVLMPIPGAGITKPPSDLPDIQILALHKSARTANVATSGFLHDVFNHRSSDKVQETLKVTKGYMPTILPEHNCNTCALTRPRDFGITRKHNTQVMLANDSLYDDPDENDADDLNGDNFPNTEYKAAVAGRQLGIMSVPRVDLHTIRPFELMFCDNKDYPCPVRGDWSTTFIVIDYLTRAKFKCDIRSKTHNGKAFERVIALNGIHKLPYACRIMSDGCGSMAHVATTASQFGIDHQYIPPHQQSLNEAEKVADTIWADARALLTHSNAPDSLFGLAVDYAMYVDLRMASTSTRNFKTPYEMIKGSQPTVSKLHRFYTLSAVNVPKARRKILAKEGTHTFAEAGRFVGFHAPFSSTYAVMLSENRLVHSINVTFDDSDFRVKSKPNLGNSADRPFEISAKVKDVWSDDPSDQNNAAGPYDAR